MGFRFVIGFIGHFNTQLMAIHFTKHYHRQNSVLSHCLHCAAWQRLRTADIPLPLGSRTVPGLSYKLKLSTTHWLLMSESELLYDWRFAASQFVFATSPFRLRTSNFIFQLNTCGYSLYVTSSLTRRWVCLLRICLAFHQVYISHM
jgi:hypothetical protein